MTDQELQQVMAEWGQIAKGYRQMRPQAPQPSDPPFHTRTRTLAQAQTERAATTESIRTENLLRGAGFDEEVASRTEPGTIMGAGRSLWRGEPWIAGGQLMDVTERAVTPLFDLLQIGQFAGAGAALEIQANGLSWEAFKRAAVEATNALPGIDEDDIKSFAERYGIDLPDPTRPSWGEVLKKTGHELFDENGAGKWSAAIGGLFLDIVLDPTTYIAPVGMIKKIPGVTRAGQAAGTAVGRTRIGAGFGRRFQKDFTFRQMARENPHLQDTIKRIVEARKTRDVSQATQMADLKDAIFGLADNMTIAERRLFGLWMDQPQFADALIRQVAKSPEEIATMRKKAQGIRKLFREMGDEDIAAGLLDPNVLRANYAPGLGILDGTSSAKALREFQDKIGIEEFRRHSVFDASRGRFDQQMAQGLEFFQKGKKYDTLEERVLAGIGTEFDFAIQASRRGAASIQRRTTQRFVDVVLSDPKIARKVSDVDLVRGQGKTLKRLFQETGDMDEARRLFSLNDEFTKMLDTYGYGIYRPLRKEPGEVINLGKLSKGDDFLDDAGAIWRVQGKKKGGPVRAKRIEDGKQVGETVNFARDIEIQRWKPEPSWVLPKPFIEELSLADKVMRGDTSEARKFYNHMVSLQNMWKGYAVLSPGFHSRNMYSNWFLNFMGGVDSPAPYIQAARLQMGKGKDIAIKLADGRMVQGDEIYKLARDMGAVKTGVIFGEMGSQVEREIMSRVSAKGAGRGVAERIRQSKGTMWDDVLRFSDEAGGVEITRKELAALVAETAPTRDTKTWLNMLFGRESPHLKANMAVGEAVENNSRLALFMTQLRKGKTPEQARDAVQRYLYDYSSLTEFERDVMRNIFPFYSWMRFNSVGMIQNVMEHPGRLAAITGKPRQAIESLSQDWKDLPTPDYFERVNATRMPREAAQMMSRWNQDTVEWMEEKGLTKLLGVDEVEQTGFQPTFFAPDMPINDLNQFNYRNILSSASPFALVPMQFFGFERGYSAFLERPIERFEGEPARVTAFPGVEKRLDRKTDQLLRDIVPTYGKVQRMRERTQQGLPLQQVLTETLGLKTIALDIQAVQRAKVFERRQRLRDLRRRLQELGEIP